MDPNALVDALRKSQSFFNNSTRCLTEDDAHFSPQTDLMTVAQQVGHVAQGIEWFAEGAFDAKGFDFDFETRFAPLAPDVSLADARARLDQAYDRACEAFGTASSEALMVALPEGPVMGGLPRFVVVSGIEEHTAHHRGALTVYSRLCGHVPSPPYEEA